ncbi:hypothetical protein LOTGIDRAFT_176469, partial [Lottia gigantea]
YKVYYVVGSGVPKLNFSLIQEYDLVIECSDKDTPAPTTTLKVKVTGNQAPVPAGLPTVKTIDAKAAQYQSINSFIYNMSVTDPEQDVLTFTMYSDPDFGYFKIDPFGEKSNQLCPDSVITSGYSIRVGEKSNQLCPDSVITSGYSARVGEKSNQLCPDSVITSGYSARVGEKSNQLCPDSVITSGYSTRVGEKSNQLCPDSVITSGYSARVGEKSNQLCPDSGITSGYSTRVGEKSNQLCPDFVITSGYST